MKTLTKIIAAVGVAATSVALTGCGIQYDGETTGCTVTDKYVTVSDKQSVKRLATSCGTFSVEDEISQGQWNSADLYARIEVGKTYDFDAYGFRNGFLSAFPNVSDAVEVEK